MERVHEVLRKNFAVNLATVDEDGKPRIRVFQVAAIRGGKIYFFTANEKKVFKQLQEEPYAEFSVNSPENIMVRVGGEIRVSKDMELKREILDLNPMVKELFKSADNPVLELIYFDSGHAEIFDLSQIPPKREQYKF